MASCKQHACSKVKQIGWPWCWCCLWVHGGWGSTVRTGWKGHLTDCKNWQHKGSMSGCCDLCGGDILEFFFSSGLPDLVRFTRAGMQDWRTLYYPRKRRLEVGTVCRRAGVAVPRSPDQSEHESQRQSWGWGEGDESPQWACQHPLIPSALICQNTVELINTYGQV